MKAETKFLLPRPLASHFALKQMLFGIILLLGLLMAFTAEATRVKNLYQATVQLTNPQTDDRSEAIREALQQVLVKVTGNPSVATLPAMQAMMAKADRLVDRYRYLSEPARLTVQFNRVLLNRWLKNAGQSIWISDRPSVLVWLATCDGEGQLTLENAEQQPSLAEQLTQAATSRGLSLSLPELDLIDLNNLAASDLLNKKRPLIERASKRYQAEAILVGVADCKKDAFTVNWQLYSPDQSLSWQDRGASQATWLARSLNRVADQFAAQYAVLAPSDEQQLQRMLVVSAITNVQQYADLIKKIEQLESVAKAVPIEISADKVYLQLTLNADSSNLLTRLTLGERLVPDATLRDNNGTLYYRWVS